MTTMSLHRCRTACAVAAGILILGGAGCGGDPDLLPVPQPESYRGMDESMARAIRTAVNAVETTPRKSQAWKQLCMVYQANELTDLAEPCYEKAIRLRPRYAWYRYQLALVRDQAGDVAGAMQAMKETTQIFKFYGPAFIRLGEWQLAAGDLEGAAESLTQALTLTPDDSAARIVMARLHLARNEFDEVIDLLEPVVQADPEMGLAYALLGKAYGELGRVDESQVALRRGTEAPRVFEDDPWLDQVRQYSIGGTSDDARIARRMATGRSAEVIPVLEEMRAADPEKLEVSIRLAQALMRADRPADALQVLREADALHPDRFEVQFELASAYQLGGDTDSALRSIERAIELDATVAEAHHRRGGILHATERFEEAAMSFRQATTISPSTARFLRAQGDSWNYAKQYDQALTSYKQALAIDPADAELHVRVGVTSLHLGRIEDAERALTQALELGPRDLQNVTTLLEQVQRARQQPAEES